MTAVRQKELKFGTITATALSRNFAIFWHTIPKNRPSPQISSTRFEGAVNRQTHAIEQRQKWWRLVGRRKLHCSLFNGYVSADHWIQNSGQKYSAGGRANLIVEWLTMAKRFPWKLFDQSKHRLSNTVARAIRLINGCFDFNRKWNCCCCNFVDHRFWSWPEPVVSGS